MKVTPEEVRVALGRDKKPPHNEIGGYEVSGKVFSAADYGWHKDNDPVTNAEALRAAAVDAGAQGGILYVPDGESLKEENLPQPLWVSAGTEFKDVEYPKPDPED